MHDSSRKLVEAMILYHLSSKTGMAVLDVGALDVNGTYRGLFKEHDYTAMDIVAGPNVDIVGWENIEPQAYDVVVCGQCAEHAENTQLLMQDVGGACKPGGLIFLVVPSRAQIEHRKPDYWRFTREGACKLLDYAGAAVVENGEAGRDVWAVGRMP